MEQTKKMAADLAYNYLQSEGIYVFYSSVYEKCRYWFNQYKDIDFVSLAALAISDPDESHLTKAEIRFFRDFYFPSKN